MTAPSVFLSRLFLSGTASFVLIGVLGAIYGVALPAFTRLYGLDTGAASLILTTHAMGGVLSVIAAVAGLRGLGARTSMVLMALGTGLIALTPGWPLTLLGSLIAGAGFGLIVTYVNRSFLSGFGERGPGMVGLVNGISGIGLIAGPLFYIWAGGNPAIVFAGIALVSLCLVAMFRPETAARTASGARPVVLHWRMAILLLNFISVSLEMAMSGLGASALIALGWSENAAATLASGFFAAFLISRLSLYWLTRRFSSEMLFLIGTIGTVIACLMAATGWEAIGYVAAGGFIGLSFPSFFVWGARVLGPDPRMSAAILLSGLSGAAFGPLVFGALLGTVGLEALFLSVAVIGGLLAVAIALSFGPARRMAIAVTNT
jgi:FHS family glucose/mannose:H+ symporter-like MFS transporter